MPATHSKSDWPIRGLSCDKAAHYIGVGKSKFMDLVADGRMPPPVRIDRRTIWDIEALNRAFKKLAGEEGGACPSFEERLDDDWRNVSL